MQNSPISQVGNAFTVQFPHHAKETLNVAGMSANRHHPHNWLTVGALLSHAEQTGYLVDGMRHRKSSAPGETTHHKHSITLHNPTTNDYVSGGGETHLEAVAAAWQLIRRHAPAAPSQQALTTA